MTLTNLSEKWAWSRSRDRVNFWALNTNSSKSAKDTNFKFGRYCPDMSLTNISEKWAWSGSRDPVNFGALNADCSKMGQTAEVTNFKFGRRVPRDSPDVKPDKCFQKVGVNSVT